MTPCSRDPPRCGARGQLPVCRAAGGHPVGSQLGVVVWADSVTIATSSRLGDSGKGGTMGTRRISRVGRLLAVAVVFVGVAVFAGQRVPRFRVKTGRSRLSTTAVAAPRSRRIDPDGSDRVQLTHTSTKHQSLWAAWSPNGREIVFDSDRTGAWQVYTMHADGSDIDKITHMRGFTGQPSWSPDGSRIVFAHSPTGNPPFNVYTMDADGGHVHRLTHSALDEEVPKYSPDGRWIVFTAFPQTGAPALYLVRADGSHFHRLTPLRLHAADGDWSPDGRRIVASTNADCPTLRCSRSAATAPTSACSPVGPRGRTISTRATPPMAARSCLPAASPGRPLPTCG